jgi:outer membrane protein OmpA-like peptidoglycan-associated protein
VRIEGHTDSRGDDAFNLDLSQRRTEAVRTYLINKGVEANRLEAKGYGETKPLVTGNNEAAWAKNRRVDFFIVERTDMPVDGTPKPQ